jgi:hypothetical protein
MAESYLVDHQDYAGSVRRADGLHDEEYLKTENPGRKLTRTIQSSPNLPSKKQEVNEFHGRFLFEQL